MTALEIMTMKRIAIAGAGGMARVRARAFLAALDGTATTCRNPPAETRADVRVAEAIVVSARERRTIIL